MQIFYHSQYTSYLVSHEIAHNVPRVTISSSVAETVRCVDYWLSFQKFTNHKNLGQKANDNSPINIFTLKINIKSWINFFKFLTYDKDKREPTLGLKWKVKFELILPMAMRQKLENELIY